MAATENTNRSVFALHGLTGMLIATALLLTILAVLTTFAIGVQQANAQNPYDPSVITDNLDNVKQISKDNINFAFKDAK